MKRINYKIGFVLLLGLCCRPVAAQQRVDVEKDLQYCHRQVARALAGLKKDGGWDYTRMPRNILAEDLKEGRTEWNCRPATPEEWCGGFGRACCGMTMNMGARLTSDVRPGTTRPHWLIWPIVTRTTMIWAFWCIAVSATGCASRLVRPTGMSLSARPTSWPNFSIPG